MPQSLSQPIILVMGSTGVGKSTFINTATDDGLCTIGHGLGSCTSNIQTVQSTSPKGHPVVFVDTPGFGDTYKSDMDILATIAAWLVKGHQQNVKLAGILYLHRMTDTRMNGSAFKNLDVFKNLCGLNAMPNVVLVTTFWTKLSADIGEKRETELKEIFWNELVANGCETARFSGDHDSAWDIINPLLSKKPIQVHLSKQLVEDRKPFNLTDAVIALKDALARYTSYLFKFIQRLGRPRVQGTELVAQDLTQQTPGPLEVSKTGGEKATPDSAAL